jgi:RsiW-degrading membrane proteinase PrsW (M82 family)
MPLGGQVRALPLALAVFTLVVGVSEEGSKFLATWLLAARRREFDEPMDGIVYGAAAALGFAALENVKYFAHGRLGASLIVARTFLSIPAHLFFGAIWGYALGQKLVSRRTSVVLFFLFAALMHGAFDTLLSIDHMGIVALALNLALATLFVTFLRRALRYGVVGHHGEDRPPEEREIFRVGLRGRFVLSVVLFYVLAFAISLQGAAVEYGHQRVDVRFVVTASALVALLAFVAYRMTSNMPLDVVLDARGVTFAGSTRTWESIVGLDRVLLRGGTRSYARLRTNDGALLLGPADTATMDNVGRAIYARIAEIRGAVRGEQIMAG